MSALPLLLLLAAAKDQPRRSSGKKAPRWPSSRHHPPHHVPAMQPMQPMVHEKPAHEHKAPAHDVHAAERHDLHEDTHHTAPAVHHVHRDHATPVHKVPHEVHEPPPAAKHVEEHHKAPKRQQQRAATPGDKSVADVQRVLVALGWRGHLTTKGPLSKDLTDGLAPLDWPEQPSVTADDWVQSARKRGLDTTFARVSSKVVHVNPATFRALQQVAQSKSGAAVAGFRIP